MPVGVTIAALAVLLGGKSGGGTSHFLIDMDKQIKSVVQDKNRRNAILSETGNLSKQLKVFEKNINSHLKDYIGVHSDYESKDSDFDSVTACFSADQQQVTKLILDVREKMRELMTKEEWDLVFQPSEK